jgi:hypothetical protein
VHGCVAGTSVRAQNGLLLPVDVQPQVAGVGIGPNADDAAEDSPAMLLARALGASRGVALLAGRGRVSLDVPAAVGARPSWSAVVQPDLTAIALDGVLTSLWDGASDPAAPARLGTLEDDLYRTGGCLTFAGNAVTLHARDYRPTDANAAPSLAVTQTSTWTGTGFTSGPRTTTHVSNPSVNLPSC